MTAVLAQVHEVFRAADDDLDPALAACVQLVLAGPHLTSAPARGAPAGADLARDALPPRRSPTSVKVESPARGPASST